ncbi:MAG: phage protein Gp37 [Candidatus Neomarinimicrobiota bacterium]
MTDENAISDAFVKAIQSGVQGLVTVEAAAGPIEEIVNQLMRYPAVLVLIGMITFSEGDESGELLEGDMTVDLLVGNKSLRSKEEGAKGAYDILKSLREFLHGKAVGLDGTVWTIKDQRPVDFRKGLAIYLQRYSGFNVHF